jgi:hypothetical protein
VTEEQRFRTFKHEVLMIYSDLIMRNYQKTEKNHTLVSFVISFKVFNYFMENCGNSATVYGVTTSIGFTSKCVGLGQ